MPSYPVRKSYKMQSHQTDFIYQHTSLETFYQETFHKNKIFDKKFSPLSLYQYLVTV